MPKYQITTRVGKEKFVRVFHSLSSVNKYLAGAKKLKKKYPKSDKAIITIKDYKKTTSKKLKKPVKEYGKKRTLKLKKKTKLGRKLDRAKKSKEFHELRYWGME